uniref:Uncharacterized protein n=1 Tax=Seriola dumerili TaxID=41447 RepID=A0A3B4TVU0_SERDU
AAWLFVQLIHRTAFTSVTQRADRRCALFSPPDHHRSTITRCRFDPQNQRVATVSADRSIRLWDLLTLCPICFTSWDKTLKLWDLQAGGFRSHGGTVLRLFDSLTLSLQDGTVRLWDIENMEEIPEVMEKRRTEGSGIHILKVRDHGSW